MKLKPFLLVAALLLVVVFLSGKTVLYYYWAALVAVVSYLNSQKLYLQEPYKLLNVLFLVYLAFVVWERTRHLHFSDWAELQINNLEHVVFGMVVCCLAYLVLKLPPFHIRSFAGRLLLSIVLFNAIGFVNEWFQNKVFDRPVFTLIPDSVKDLRMNVWGTSVFILVSVAVYSFTHKRKEPVMNSPY